jgi:hypothetical protein
MEAEKSNGRYGANDRLYSYIYGLRGAVAIFTDRTLHAQKTSLSAFQIRKHMGRGTRNFALWASTSVLRI